MSSNWEQYVDGNGDFNLALYMFRTVNFLMKSTLDFGTMVSTDQQKLRAYKEQVKTLFKGKWLEVAEALEAFDIIIPCGCPPTQFCTTCGGSRYILNTVLSADELRDITVVTSPDDPKVAQKLQEGLERAMEETSGRRDYGR